jgi:hypothetical protein
LRALEPVSANLMPGMKGKFLFLIGIQQINPNMRDIAKGLLEKSGFSSAPRPKQKKALFF